MNSKSNINSLFHPATNSASHNETEKYISGDSEAAACGILRLI